MLDVLAGSLEEGETEHMVILRHERGKLRISMKDGNTDTLHNGLFEEVFERTFKAVGASDQQQYCWRKTWLKRYRAQRN